MKGCNWNVGGALKCLFVSGVWLTGCGAEYGDYGEEVNTTEQAVFYESWEIWDKKIINVCFETSGYSTERTWVRNVLKGQRSWENSGRVNFVGFRSCGTNENGIRVNFHTETGGWTWPRDGGKTAMFLGVGTRVDCTNREQCFKHLTLHEFGHAIGMSHEQNRSDKPSTCTASQDLNNAGDIPWGPFDSGSIMAYDGGTCSQGQDLSVLDQQGTDHFYGAREGDFSRLGDFNGDGKGDLLCHDAARGYKWVDFAEGSGQFNGTNFSTTQNWCGHDAAKLYKGDFNGDGRTDILCHDLATGNKWIDYSESVGAPGAYGFTGTNWSRTTNWCSHDSGRLLIGDFNGDDKDDIMCFDTDTGYQWIDYAWGTGVFMNTDWSYAVGWCNLYYHRVFVGDFNGDGQDDLLCQDYLNGNKYIDYADSHGHFGGTDYATSINWCSQPGEQLYIGDFDGNGTDDLLCHDANTGSMSVDYANSFYKFNGSDWSRTSNWCRSNIGRLLIGDVNGDGADDLLCHNIRDGSKFVDLAYPVAGAELFGGTDWSRSGGWCSADTAILR